MRRRTLVKAVRAAFLLLFLAFVFILLSSLGGKSSQRTQEQFSGIQEGVTELRRYQGERVWITRLSEQDRAQLAQSHECKSSPLCAIPAKTMVDGIELVFSALRPAQLSTDEQWQGGFVDPTTGEVYNLVGVGYRLAAKAPTKNLRVIAVN